MKDPRLHTKTAPLAPNYTLVGRVLITFAHLVGKYFKYLGLRDAKIESEEARRESRHQSCRQESIIAMDASR